MKARTGRNLEWWEERRDASLERRHAARAATSGVNPDDAFLVVTEGKVTEPTYFCGLRELLRIRQLSVKVTRGRTPDPRQVIRTARELADKQVRLASSGQLGVNEPPEFDHVWAVVDTDAAVRDGYWHEVQEIAVKCRVSLAHSTPCFEFWLLLHLAAHATTRTDLPDGKAAKRAVRKALGRDYSTNGKVAWEAIGSLVHEWPKAVAHAEQVRQHHLTVKTPAPANPSTEVDHLTRALNDLATSRIRGL